MNSKSSWLSLVCQDCGKQDGTVGIALCPYMFEIHYERVEIVVCKECFHERCMEI